MQAYRLIEKQTARAIENPTKKINTPLSKIKPCYSRMLKKDLIYRLHYEARPVE